MTSDQSSFEATSPSGHTLMRSNEEADGLRRLTRYDKGDDDQGLSQRTTTMRMRMQRQPTIVDWIYARQLSGLNYTHHQFLHLGDYPSRFGNTASSSLYYPQFRRTRGRLHPRQLASSIAWNVNRMQNMIMAIGPETPAYAYWKSRRGRSDAARDERGEAEIGVNSRGRVIGGAEEESDDADADENDAIQDDNDSSSSSPSPSSSASLMDPEASFSEPEHGNNDHDAAVDVEVAMAEVLSQKDSDDEDEDDSPRSAERPTAMQQSIATKAESKGRTQIEHMDENNANKDHEVDDVDGNDEDDEEDEHMMEDDEDARLVHEAIMAHAENDEDEQEDVEDEMQLLAAATQRRVNAIRNLRRRLRAEDEEEEEDDDVEGEDGPGNVHQSASGGSEANGAATSTAQPWHPSMRHGGCINTACWLDCPWRLSTVRQTRQSWFPTSSSPMVVDSQECPTQIITSGDDRLVKFWDVRYAMGSSSPLRGGWDTISPFANRSSHGAGRPTSSNLHKSAWNQYYRDRRHSGAAPAVAGSVFHLETVSTGHRGNVFHVTPIPTQPGKILTCGADGYLRLSDLQATERSSSVIVHPYISEEANGGDASFVFHTGMAFSHTLMSPNTGLLCSERGLHKFDLRLPPREQQGRSILHRSVRGDDSWRTIACKCCAVWSPQGSSNDSDHTSWQATMSHYVFAGGSSEFVGLYDLRMDGGQSTIVQRYKPQYLELLGNVSVSGIDISKDGKEMLVSYESDQIYSFPICPTASSAAGPTREELESCHSANTSTVPCINDRPFTFVSELASYGGHLNRFTFLKNAKYAGPNDEYICSGSDSGHAWVFERRTGTVAAFLGADNRTCNGVIPHPTLPYFISYGIDSTAKLWRATVPVDPGVDDSPVGRGKAAKQARYTMSPVVAGWDHVQLRLKQFERPGVTVLPDFIPTNEEIASGGRFSWPFRPGISGPESPNIGNALRALPLIIRKSRFECYKAYHGDCGFDRPIEQPLAEFTHRVSIIRLRLQADRLGLRWNPNQPCRFESGNSQEGSIDLADLIPDNPSDWILFDRRMKDDVYKPLHNFNCGAYDSILQATFPLDPSFLMLPTDRCEGASATPWLDASKQDISESCKLYWRTLDDDKNSGEPSADVKMSRKLLYESAALLKDAGNKAVKEGMLHLAAMRYDKGIQYCAVALMNYVVTSRDIARLSQGHHVPAVAGQALPGNSVVVWSPLLRLLITLRLNLALLLMKPEFGLANASAEQARAALKLLGPFCTKVTSRISNGKDATDSLHKLEVDQDDYATIKSFEAKAFFRLGSVKLELGDYGGAIKQFESSMMSSFVADPNAKPDALLQRRLQDAKHQLRCKKKRDRKRYQRMLDDD